MRGNPDKISNILVNSQQSIGAQVEPESLVKNVDIAELQHELVDSGGKIGYEPENPFILHCKDNIQGGCSSLQRVLSSAGWSLAFNAHSPIDTFSQSLTRSDKFLSQFQLLNRM